MTAVQAPARPAPVVRRVHVTPPVSFLRLLGIETRRSQMPLILPLIALLFWFDSYRPSASVSPKLYVLVTFWNMGQGHTIIDFGPFVAGMAAWIGSRDGRRGTADLITATVRPRWAAQVATWAGAAIWAVGGYLVFVGIMFAVYAHNGVTGEPPWWWVAVGATAVAAFTAAGFTLGALFPNRFVAPVAAFFGFFAMMMSSQTGFHDPTGWALILPTNSNGNFEQDSGIFYPYLPDLPIARIMFLAGIAVAFLGILGWAGRGSGRWLRVAGVVVTACGVAATSTAVGLAGTAKLTATGIEIPALHDAASDQPIAYTPVCDGSTFRVCVNPAYKAYLAYVTQALTPVVAQTSGLPGTPVSARQVAATYQAGEDGGGMQPLTITGDPPVLDVPLGSYSFLPGAAGFTNSPVARTAFKEDIWVLYVAAFTGAGNGQGTQAQQAVQLAMLWGAGVPLGQQPQEFNLNNTPYSAPVIAAAKKLAALSGTARHDWLTTHLAALRAGGLTLEQIP
jgi:hypothetical protein